MSCWSQPGVNYNGLVNTIPTDYHKYMSIINAAISIRPRPIKLSGIFRLKMRSDRLMPDNHVG